MVYTTACLLSRCLVCLSLGRVRCDGGMEQGEVHRELYVLRSSQVGYHSLPPSSIPARQWHAISLRTHYCRYRVPCDALLRAVIQDAPISHADWYVTSNMSACFGLTGFLGIALVIVGQILRSGAMIHAGTSFSHTVAFRKLPDHVLVTDGIYA